VFSDTDALDDELQAHMDAPVEFYVYNADTDEVRVAVLMPSADWGGEGILGAAVACGYLHKLPASCCETIGQDRASSASRRTDVTAAPPSVDAAELLSVTAAKVETVS
jgi:hypothetical protein